MMVIRIVQRSCSTGTVRQVRCVATNIVLSEGGTRIPAIVRWPKKITQPRGVGCIGFTNRLAGLFSFPWLMQGFPKERLPDSFDRLGNWLGTDSTDRPWVIEQASNHTLSVRTKDWKYIEP